MNYIRAQKQIFNDIVNGNRVCGFWVDDDRFFVTGDAFHGFVFPKEIIAFDVNKVNQIKPVCDFNAVSAENELKETNDFKLAAGKMMRVFVHYSGRRVLINVNFLKHFQNAKYYQTDENKAAMVTEEIRGKRFPVGVVLPIRYSPAKEFDGDD